MVMNMVYCRALNRNFILEGENMKYTAPKATKVVYPAALAMELVVR